MKRIFQFNKILFASIILSTKVIAGGSVTFSPSLIPCGTLGCGPVTISNATSKTVWFAGLAVNYRDPNVPFTDFSYVYTGCANGVILPGSSCNAIINPNGSSLIPGRYSARPLFNRALNDKPENLLQLFLDVQTGVECTDDSQCTSPDTCDSGTCATAVTCVDDTFLGIIGDATGGFSEDIDLQSCGGDVYMLTGVSLSTGSFKFRTNNAWTVNYGDNAPIDGILDLGGSFIDVTAGTYDITVNMATLAYTITSS